MQFHGGSTAELESVPESAWPALLRALDDHGLTLPLGIRRGNALPCFVQARIERNLADNAQRHTRLVEAYREVTSALQVRGIGYAVLKGLSRWPYYCSDLRHRPSYDIDLYCPENAISRALAVLTELGYEPVHAGSHRETDHLPRMIRKTGWIWRQNYYDPEMPLAVELHFRFWDEVTEHFSTGDTSLFWHRRVIRDVAGMPLPVLNPVDALSYSALHLVRHLLRGALRLHHVYEMGHFLEASAADDAFWAEWRDTGLASCRGLEAIAFRVAREWFQCDIHPVAREAVEQLPHSVERWFELFGNSPALIAGSPNKNELWLHCCLLTSARDRREIVLRRLFPVRRGRVILNPHVQPDRTSLRMRIEGRRYACVFLAQRAAHHCAAIVQTLRSGLLWWRVSNRSPALRPRKPHSGTRER